MDPDPSAKNHVWGVRFSGDRDHQFVQSGNFGLGSGVGAPVTLNLEGGGSMLLAVRSPTNCAEILWCRNLMVPKS